MLNDMPALTHEQQQLAVERIQALMAEGMSSGAAIAQVARELRAGYTGERVTLRWEEDTEVLETPAARAETDPYDSNPDDD
ncbi:hypothetical protein SGGMMB4_02974 [Sodalis glossinidius str. 'morsitans']|uniref:UPF0181 protein SG1330 n=2 Tax=Sodalis glossinidius (strain morsitans) TaxID=343509 RepID=Y1330_SODGM|nr:RecName: Full=UPF0181 protein SG1330 [Sodalis glossinidius str. 'morsitans']BAE74605.1 conserved hypothetical protein [Sodalis glossinidius str. 'morsitans']CRL45333.1 hypothetical protein SGGMMB4_02974 [Sodalis glossinidius str. 'morsitans']